MDPADVRRGGVGTQKHFGKSNEHGNKITHSQGPVYSVPFNVTAPTDNKTKVRLYGILILL